MPNSLGFVLAGSAAIAQVVLRPYRAIIGRPTGAPEEAIVADAVVSEHHSDDVHMTDHPVEQGANITDHAFRQPAVLTMVYGWAAGSINAISQAGFASGSGQADPDFLSGMYEKLRKLARERTLCSVFTGKRFYESMLIRSLSLETNKETEHALLLRITMREVLIARTQITTLSDNSVQASPQSTGVVYDQGPQQLGPLRDLDITGGLVQ